VLGQVGDLFTESLYDIHIKLQGVPMLEWGLPKVAFGLLNARSVMASEVVCLGEAEPPEKLRKILRRTTHHAFPLTYFHVGTRTVLGCH